MSNLFGMMNSSTTGLQASQVGVNTSLNNITNVNTVGYTRQRTIYGTNTPVYFRGVGYTGAGVHVQDIQRLRDQHLEAQIRTENSKYNEIGAKLEGLEQIENIFGEPSDTGLSAIFNDFFNNLEELKKDPSNVALQSLIKENGQTIADTINQFSAQLDKLSQSTTERKDDLLATAADLINSINEVNQNLEKAYKTDPTKSPNDLLDQRDNLLRELSGIMDIEVKINDNQTVNVTVKTEDGPVSIKDINSKDDLVAIEEKIESGALKGYNDQLEIIENYKASVDGLINTVSEQLNSVINVSNGDMFSVDAEGKLVLNTNPGDITLNTDKLSTAKQEVIGAFKTIISNIGSETKKAQDSLKSQETILTHLQNKAESLSGVSMDEEVTFLVQFQKSYEANAKVISTITDMLETIINRMGV